MEHCLRRSYLKGNQKLKRSSESKRFPWPNKYRRYWTVSKINVVESMSLSQEFIDHIIDLLVSTPHDTHRKALPPLLACLHIISLSVQKTSLLKTLPFSCHGTRTSKEFASQPSLSHSISYRAETYMF